MMWISLKAPSLAEIEAMAHDVFGRLPGRFRGLCEGLIIHVDDFPSDEVLDDLGIEDPFELTGLYQGVDLSRRSVLDPSPEPARIFLYRRPILDEWAERGDVSLAELVAHVLTHEIGHHVGLSDEDMAAIEDSVT